MGRFVVANHSALFDLRAASATSDAPRPPTRCDVCDLVIHGEESEGFALPGRGLYVWERGGDRRTEEPHLCADCGTAIGVTARALWDVEEEEG